MKPSVSSPSKSFVRVSWGTLHPHPRISENLVRRKPGSRPSDSGSNWLRKVHGVLLTSSCTAAVSVGSSISNIRTKCR
ncbi:hypothetical protein JTE90_027703 [Oedothorax gibbosus]|uniref:Uncharacterized protein n=1 Tax=Oedothorax gibbosus TaxID=931172 RepID=A0AAV6UVU7_9ARAC|nr:hypothetical protein JTE90_027703 [Oedothorax gibbosus]